MGMMSDLPDDIVNEIRDSMQASVGDVPISTSWLESMPVKGAEVEAIYLHLLHDGDDRVINDEIDHATWLDFYDDEWGWMRTMMASFERGITGDDRHSHRLFEIYAWMGGLIVRANGERPSPEDCEAAEAAIAESNTINAKLIGFYRDWVRRIEQSGPSSRDIERVKASAPPEVKQFMARVWVPCVMCFGKSPQYLMRLARQGDTEAVEKLLTLDKAATQDKALAELVFREGRNPDSPFMKAVKRGMNKRPPKLSARDVQLRMAAFASAMSRDFNEGVTNPEIREAMKRSAGRQGAEVMLPATDDELRVYMNRYRKQFVVDVPLPPPKQE